MRGFDFFPKLLTRLTTLIATWRQRPDFVCGDCERWERCGLPPSDKCIAKAEQIARKAETGTRANPLPYG
jgi:hypothetical protein